MTLYKAVRPDGTDFHTGRVDYVQALRLGVAVIHPAPRLSAGASRYLSAATVPTECTGMRWPCRLLAVEVVGESRPCSDYPNKIRAVGLRPVAELDARLALGPSADAVLRVLAQIKAATPDQWRALDTAWAGAGAAAWSAGADPWAAARAARAARAAAGVAAWAAAGAAVANARDAAWAAVTAHAPAWAAVLHDLVGQLGYTAEHEALLVGPWASVFGLPWEAAA